MSQRKKQNLLSISNSSLGMSRHLLVVSSSSLGITLITIIVMLAFFEEVPLIILRNVVAANIIFVLAYWIWLKVYGYYQKMYKLGLNE